MPAAGNRQSVIADTSHCLCLEEGPTTSVDRYKDCLTMMMYGIGIIQTLHVYLLLDLRDNCSDRDTRLLPRLGDNLLGFDLVGLYL